MCILEASQTCWMHFLVNCALFTCMLASLPPSSFLPLSVHYYGSLGVTATICQFLTVIVDKPGFYTCLSSHLQLFGSQNRKVHDICQEFWKILFNLHWRFTQTHSEPKILVLRRISFCGLMPCSSRSDMKLGLKANLLNFHPGRKK